MCKRVVTQSVQERFSESCCPWLGGLNDHSCCCCTSCMSFFFFLFLLAHEPAALKEHIMELKHLTDCKLYPDRDYFPVKYYPVRVYTYVFIYSFHLLSRPGLHTTRPGLFPYHLLSRPGL